VTDQLIFKNPIGTLAWMAGVWATPTDFTRSLAKMVAYNYESGIMGPHEFVHIDDQPTSYHSAARNALAKRFMGDWLLQLDTDHVFEPDLLARMVGLIRKWDVDVLTAVYRTKIHPYLPNLFWWDEAGQQFVQMAAVDWNQPLAEIKCSGAGALLIRRKVFDRIREELHEEPFDIIHPYSEDFGFYRRCIKLGIKTYVAPQICVDHLIPHPITHADFDQSAIDMMPVPDKMK
jgi:hypothetical protein